ncbi:hypothetical protein [Campylobacter sp. 19-13652]|uniref:hypothetical protein n=1 Tax=Campylobacter sp. 19-13652 TaxID=2840180 RepID=UPI001C798136|nr:hypothetical protein [Campylobacter sp. 19-13652]BCX78752.1 hypothetical protein LBC_02140 [Campylobacter sp. 19-13652]
MKFDKFKGKKALSLANLLSADDFALANELLKADYYYLSYLDDNALDASRHIKSEIGAASYALAMLAAYKFDQMEPFKSYDIGHLSGESNIGEEEAQRLAKWVFETGNEAQIIIDKSFFAHHDSKFIFSILSKLGLSVVLAGGADDKSQALANELSSDEVAEPAELESFDGSVVYLYASEDAELLRANQSWLSVAKVANENELTLSAKDGFNKTVKVKMDNSIKGTVAMLATKNITGYNFKLVKVDKA